MKSNKEKFQEWLSLQGKLKLSPDQIIHTIDEASQYALTHDISKVAFFDIEDPKLFISISTKLLSQRFFRRLHKQTAQNLEKYQAYYKRYLKELETQKMFDEKTFDDPDLPESEGDIALSNKLSSCLEEISDTSKYGVTLHYLAKQVGVDTSAVKRILDKAKWAKLEYGRYFFNSPHNNRKQQYRFENPQTLAYTKPISVSYFGKIVTRPSTWKQLLLDVMRVLHDDRPHQIEKIKGKILGSAAVPFVVGEDQVFLMRVPREFVKGLFVETNLSATGIMLHLKYVIEMCNIDYKNVVVLFERKDQASKSKECMPLLPQASDALELVAVSEAREPKQTMEDEYYKWLREVCGLADATAKTYVSAVHTAEKYAKQHMYHEYQIYGSSKPISLAIISQLLTDQNFLRNNRDRSSHVFTSFRRFSEFIEFIEKKSISGEDTTEDISARYPQLYSKLYTASMIYDDPLGMDVAKISSIVGCRDFEKVYEILKNVPWATEVDSGKFSFSKRPIVNVSNGEPQDFDKEKYISILLQRYRNGMTFDSIDFDVFREIYEDSYDEKIEFNDDELAKRLKLCGIVYKDRLFPAEGIIDNETKKKLFDYIENSFSSDKKVLYYKAIFEDLSDDFANCFTLSDEEMLKAFIMYTAPKDEYYFFDRYMSTEAEVEIDHSAEIADYLLSVGKPTGKNEICQALSHIPQDRVNQILSADSRFLRNAKGEFFHRDIFEISDSELEQIAGYISNYIDENEYAIWTDIWNKIQDEMTVFLENNLYLSALGVRNAIAKFYTDRFKFNGAVISRIGKNYEMRDVYQLYAKHHEKFSADDIYHLSKELDTVIYFDALSEISVRVSYDLFVSKACITFDVEAVDKAIGSFIAGDFIPIREIDSFLAFPGIGREWNEYMLESFLKSYSKKYILLNNGSSLHNVAGVVAKKDGAITEFVDACATIIADGYVELKKDQALNYLAELNIITQRRYKDIDIALQKAKQLRVQKG